MRVLTGCALLILGRIGLRYHKGLALHAVPRLAVFLMRIYLVIRLLHGLNRSGMSVICNLRHIKSFAAQFADYFADFAHLVGISYSIGSVKSYKIHSGIHKQHHVPADYIFVVRTVIAVKRFSPIMRNARGIIFLQII